jgi:hypothetical protein
MKNVNSSRRNAGKRMIFIRECGSELVNNPPLRKLWRNIWSWGWFKEYRIA